jgi:hypothetical protein
MRIQLVTRAAVGLAGVLLTLSIPAAASAAGKTAHSEPPISVATTEFGGWYSSFDACTAVGRDYLHGNGATGFSCRERNGQYALWVYYP